MATILKDVENVISSRSETSTNRTVNGSSLVFTLCDRTNLASAEANYFSSFSLPFERDALFSGDTTSKTFPERQQLNVDRIVICPIPREDFGELVDGRTISFTVPQQDGGSISAKTIVSSTYSSLEKAQAINTIGDNLAFLFSDDINTPYVGTVQNGTVSKVSNTTWDTSNALNRPAAVSYNDLSTNDINSDDRDFLTVNQAVPVGEEYPTNTNQGYNYDIPVGIVYLDKGFMVFTHPDIVDNIPFDQGIHLTTGLPNTGVTSATTNIYFSDTSKSSVSFKDIDVSFKTTVIALALPGEFMYSTNSSFDRQKFQSEAAAGTNNFDSVFITEVGIYNNNNTLIAIAKTDRPIEKTPTNVLTFTLDLEV